MISDVHVFICIPKVDSNHDGLLSHSEVKLLLKKLTNKGLILTVKNADDFLKSADKNHDGKVQQHEFRSGGQESYPLRIFTLGRSGRWTAAGRSSAGRQTADGRSSDGRPAGRPGGARVVSGAEKKII